MRLLPTLIVLVSFVAFNGRASAQATSLEFDSISAFQGANTGGAQIVVVAGYYGHGTPGGGTFALTTSLKSDNGGTIILSHDGHHHFRVDQGKDILITSSVPS